MIMHTVDQKQGLEFTADGSVTTYLRTGWLRAVMFALVWWVLTDGAMDSWLIGIPVVLFATMVSVFLLPAFSLSVLGIMRFIPFFLWHSLHGGIDVAKRVLQPKLLISPAMLSYRWRLPPGMSRVFMANTVSLLPGTLSTELEAAQLHVHVFNQAADFESEMALLERRVAQLFGQSLMASEE